MPVTWTFVKKSGAPAGAITINVDNQSFLINDTTTTTITTTAGDVAADLKQHPFLTLQGVAGTYTPPSAPVNIPDFTPNYAYPAAYVINHGGTLYQANVAFTSGASFNAADWTSVSGPGGGGGGITTFQGRSTAAAVLTKADVTGTSLAASDVGALAAANNLSDVADPGTSRANVHVPSLTPAQAAATSNIALSGLQKIDGYQTVANDIVLATGQATPSQNGPWLVASGAWARPAFFPTGQAGVKGRTMTVLYGQAGGGTFWQLQAPSGGLTIDTTAQTWIKQSQDVPLLGSRILAVGHSFLQGAGAKHVNSQFITLLGGLTRAAVRDLGVGASQAAQDQQWGGPAPAWVSNQAYALNQIVSYGGIYYINILAVTSTTAPLNDATHWTAISTGTLGVGGWAWVLQNVVPFGANGAPYTPGQNALPLICTGINDITQHANDAGTPTNIFKEAIRTHIARFCAASLYQWNDPSVTFSGYTNLFVKPDTTRNSGTAYLPFDKNGYTLTYTLPADFEGGSVHAMFVVNPSSDGLLTITNGTASGAATYQGSAISTSPTKGLSGLAYAAGGTGTKRNSSNGVTVRISGFTSADAGKTFTITYSGGGGTTFSTPAAPGAITQGGTAGGATYTYTRVYLTYNGYTQQSAATSTATGSTTLTGVNFNTIPAGPAWPAGVEQELIIRTVGGTTVGVVAVLTGGPAAVNDTSAIAGGVAIAAPTNPTANPLVGGAAYTCWSVESNAPATRVGIYNIPTLPAAHLAALGITSGQIAAYNTAINAVAAEFTDVASQVTVLDLDTWLGASTSLFNASPNVHPTNRGYALIGANSRQAISALARSMPESDQAFQSRVARGITGRTHIRSPLPLAANIAQPVSLWGVGASPYTAVNTGYTTGTAATWVDVDPVNVLLTIDAEPGDDLVVLVNGLWGAQAFSGALDACTCLANGNALNYFSSGTATPWGTGQPAWFNNGAAAQSWPISGESMPYTVQPADLQTYFSVPGIVLVKLRMNTSGGRLLYQGLSGIGLGVQLRNLGPRNTPGFNAS